MNLKKINRIIRDTAYVRTGGTAEELKCANYLVDCCAELGLAAHLEEFEVPMAEIHTATLTVDGTEIPCKGYFCCGSGEVEAPFYYLRHNDAGSLAQCKGKIVMVDGYLGYWVYQDILANGAVGFITYNGDMSYPDKDIDQRELRAHVHKGNRILGVNINVKSAVSLIKQGAKTAKIVIDQTETMGHSRNVVMDIPGDIEETIVFTAHYDSTSLSQGSYDNMSGSIGLLGIAEQFAKKPHRYGMRFVWCGSEERGLLGSKAYVAAHEEELGKFALNVNLDMIGCIMGKFLACCSTEEKLVHYIEYLSQMAGFGVKAYQDVYSSDSTPFADKGVPALSFARMAPTNTATIHNRYDTPAVMSAAQMAEDIDFLNLFADNMANAAHLPVAREIPDAVKEKLDVYLTRKRGDK